MSDQHNNAPAVPQVSAIKSALNGMLTFFGMDEDENSKPVFDKARKALTLEFQPYTTIDMGHGKFEVGAGKTGGLPCIAFGRNGTGKVGEPMTTGPRQMSVEETFAVITFANVTGLDVLQETMDQVREEFFPGTTPQFSATPAPAHAVPQGWKLVPVEIDPDMVGAFVDASAIEGPCWAEATDGEKQEVVRMWAQCWAALLAATPAAPSQPAVPQGEQIKKALGKLKSTQMCHPNAVQCLIEEAIDALATTPAPAPAHAFNGWYCAHCQRGVDGSEVTYHEQHTVCGRVITDDVPPAPAPAQEVGQGDHVSIGRVMAEQWLSAMEGVIDVADRKTDEFDALRKSIIDLTLLLHAGPAPTQNGELTVDAVMAIFQKRFPRTRLSNAWRDSAEDIISALRAKGGK